MVWGGKVRVASRGLGPAASVALLLAAVWGLALVVAGFLAPAYESVSTSSSGVLVLLNLLALMSIGLFVVPLTAALVVACSTCRPPPRAKVQATQTAAGA